MSERREWTNGEGVKRVYFDELSIGELQRFGDEIQALFAEQEEMIVYGHVSDTVYIQEHHKDVRHPRVLDHSNTLSVLGSGYNGESAGLFDICFDPSQASVVPFPPRTIARILVSRVQRPFVQDVFLPEDLKVDAKFRSDIRVGRGEPDKTHVRWRKSAASGLYVLEHAIPLTGQAYPFRCLSRLSDHGARGSIVMSTEHNIDGETLSPAGGIEDILSRLTGQALSRQQRFGLQHFINHA